MSKLRLIFRMEIQSGRLEEFKEHAAVIVSMVKDKGGDRTLGYEWYLNEDKMECVFVETFADSEALLSHADYISEKAFDMFSLAEMRDIWLCGSPSQAVLDKMAAFAPTPYALVGTKD